MASYLKDNFGCYNALFLDAGASSAMVYSWKVLSQGNRDIITDAFVVVDRDAFLKLQWKPSKTYTPYKPDYRITSSDWEKVKEFTDLIDSVYEKYWKTKYRTQLISIFRWAIKDGLSESKKAIYNQVLIYLFTIEDL